MIVTIKQNDTYPDLRARLQMRTGKTIRIEGAEIRLILMDENDNIHLNKMCTIENAIEGYVSYRWLPQDTATAGEYRAEFEVKWANGSIVTVPNDGYFTVNIVKELGGSLIENTPI